MAPEVTPPVCRVMDYSRYYYELKKKRKDNLKKSKVSHLKQIRLSPNIGKNDLQMKFKRIKEFLNEGHKVKINMMFKGRQKEHLGIGREILEAIIRELASVAVSQGQPSFEGYYMSATMIPSKEGKTVVHNE